jgi:predicted transcriptional regulator
MSTALSIQAVDPALEIIEIASINRDVQVRIKTDPGTVDDYHRALNADPPASFPRIVCFRDPKTGTIFLADGNHRLESRIKNGETTIEAEVREGGKREALAYALGSSKGHGLRFSNADKRKAVTLAFALKGSDKKKLSDNQIAALVGVSQPFVSNLRKREAKPITVITPEAKPGADPTPQAGPTIDRLVTRFRKLLGEVPENEHAAFSERVLSVLSEIAPAAE